MQSIAAALVAKMLRLIHPSTFVRCEVIDRAGTFRWPVRFDPGIREGIRVEQQHSDAICSFERQALVDDLSRAVSAHADYVIRYLLIQDATLPDTGCD